MVTTLYVLLVVNAVLAVFSLCNAVAAVRYAHRAEDALRRADRDRYAFNYQTVYGHPRSIR